MSNSRPNSDYLRLCKAIEKRDNRTACKLIQNNVNVNVPNVRGNTPLHLAIIKFDNLDIITMLLDRGANIHAKNHHNQKPLEVAIQHYNSNAVLLLIKRGALTEEDLNALLLKVIKENKYEIVKILIDHALQNDSSTDLKIFLDAAISCRESKIIETILSHCRFVQPSDRYIPTELIIKSADYNDDCIDLLLKWNFTVNPESKQNGDFIYAAVEKGYLQIVLQLLEFGIDVNMVNPKTRLNLLKIACLKKHYEIVELLLKHDACINETTPTNIEVLNDLSQFSCINLLNSFLFYRKKFSEITCLHIAVLNSDPKMTKLLLENGATIIDDPTFFNITCIAIRINCEEIVRMFLDRGVNVNDINSEGKSLLHFCVASQNCQEDNKFDIAKLLLEKGATTHIQTPGNPLLYEAIKNRHQKTAQLFLDYNADIQYVSPEGTSLLHKAIENDFNPKFIESLLKHDFPVNVVNGSRFTPLLYACKFYFKNLSGIVKILLDYNADVNCTDCNMMTPLHFACLIRNLEVVAALLEKGANPTATNKEGRTPLHCVCGYENMNIYISANTENSSRIIQLLLQHNANIEAVDEKGWTPLFVACIANNNEAVKCLLDNQANANHVDVDNLTPIYVAMKNCTYNTEPIKILLKHKVNVNYINEQGKSIVHMIVEKNKAELIKSLAHTQVNFNSVDKEGNSPLHIAVLRGYVDVIRDLLKYGANVNILNKKKQTPLRIAIKYMLKYRNKYRSARDDSEEDDFSSWSYIDQIDTYKKIVKSLKILVVKLKVAELKVNNQNFDIVYNSDDNEMSNGESSDEEEEAKIQQLDVLKLEIKCEREIEKLKMESVGVDKMTFYDLLTKNIHFLSKFVKNKEICQILEQQIYDKKFPLYIDIIRNRFRDAKCRSRMLNSAKKYFNLNVTQCLTDNCIDIVFSYLKTKELNIFIRSMKRLD